jgi:hypothetical protein
VLLKDLGLRWGEQTVKTPQDGQWQDDLAVLVALVRSPKEVADTSDEVGELRMSYSIHS